MRRVRVCEIDCIVVVCVFVVMCVFVVAADDYVCVYLLSLQNISPITSVIMSSQLRNGTHSE